MPEGGDGNPTLRQSYLRTVGLQILANLHVPSNPGKDAITYATLTPRLSKEAASPSSLQNFHVYRVAAADFDMVWAFGYESKAICGIVSHFGPQAGRITTALRDDLFAHRSLARHPMLLGLLAHCHIAPQIENWLNIHAGRVVEAARDSGFHHDLDIAERRRVIDTELGERSAIVSGVAANIATNRYCWEGLYGLAKFIVQECDRLGQSQVHDGGDQWLRSNAYITQHANCCVLSALALREEAGSWQKKADIQIQGLFNLIAQRDQNQSIGIASTSKSIAEESKKDSTSMKALAVVTICCLPGTFISSLFAIPFFQWDADSGNGVVNQRIWVYWAFALPLTGLILSLFLIWDRHMTKQAPIAKTKN
ncbi:uncharacterized protein PV07_00051 [Cladophialophora immunda]|uniref:Uncharacterized protein n=1 Tax=Cladophialophora immunda TaxID=569365 RepID=A0A0D2CTD5_9EURO|nr:uncharacterized protein PV07_00051 [Cladophialophora immunda]KIW33180.1 hypothetical protein PV07_00051 [Cladophialophora immunda]